jgi:glutamate--cysteine ligase
VADQQEESPQIQSIDQLEEWFHQGARPRDAWKIGVEYEKPVVDASTGEAVPYEGPRGIGQLLAGMLERSDYWRGVYEGENLIALEDGRASITLEPGGQLEMSGEQCDSIHCADRELQRHVSEILAVGEDLGLWFLGLGATPKTPLSGLPWMPKQRYRIMRGVMQRVGTMGHRMMQQTATVQANFDFADEQDAARKMRVSMAMSPLLVGMSANSPVLDGRPTGYKSFRAHVWTDTDDDRCGVLPFVFGEDSIFAAYTQWALDVPMYFVVRGSTLIEPETRTTFRQFLDKGLAGERATIADWSMHLTTLFPEVRLKRYIEIRQADSQGVELMLGTPALMKGILYDDDCLGAVYDELASWSAEDVTRYREDAARQGLSASVGRFTLGELAREVVSIAREGLKRQQQLDPEGRDESIFLDKLEEDVRDGRCPADRLIEAWEGSGNRSVDRLIAESRYLTPKQD